MNDRVGQAPPLAPQVHSAIVEVMRRLGAIGKSRQNKEQRYSFRGIDDLYNALHPIMAEVGLYALPIVSDVTYSEIQSAKGSKGWRAIAEVRYKVTARDGSAVELRTIGEAIDYGDKATPKALTMAHKAALLQLFMVATEENLDTENANHDIPAEQSDDQRLQHGKRSLLALVAQKREKIKSDLSHQEWAALVVQAALGKDRIESFADLEKVREALQAGAYDLDTGKRRAI